MSAAPIHPSDGVPVDRERSARERRICDLESALSVELSPHREEQLRDELISVTMPVARAIARRYRDRGIPFEDLEQVAYLGLTKAGQRFDPRSGHAFLSFCVPTIRGEVRRYFRDHGWMVRPPRSIQERQAELIRVRTELASETGRAPTIAELAERTGYAEAVVREAMDVGGAFSPASLDAPAGPDDGDTLAELLPGHEEGRPAAEARVLLAPLVSALAGRDRQILRMRFFDDLTQREIAETIGVTQMQVSRLLARIMKDLRERVGEIPGPLTSAG